MQVLVVGAGVVGLAVARTAVLRERHARMQNQIAAIKAALSE
jgi:2-polyprenyl-6-methoxyphenol hydroxylase-like FAD-dependent oxidoreductase